MAHAKLRKIEFISRLKEAPTDGRILTGLFAVVRKNLAMSSRNKPYLRLTLGDKSGTMEAFVWDDAGEYNAHFGEGDIISVSFRLRVRNDIAQMHVESLETLSEKDLAGLRWEDFRPGLPLSVRKQLWEETERILDAVTTPCFRHLAETFTGDPGFRDAFLTASAAKGFHHAYVGGLAEHTLTVMRLARVVADLYPGTLDSELLLMGAFLHDLGKIEELSVQTGEYTDSGRLVGHIFLGVRLLHERAARVPEFPRVQLLQLEHLVLSHHGQREWGSPVEPQTLEALCLSFLDNLDAKLAGASEWLENEGVQAGQWSSFWRGLGRQLFRTQKTEGGSPRGATDANLRELADEFPQRAEGDPIAGPDLEEGAVESIATSRSRSGTRAKKEAPGQGELEFKRGGSRKGPSRSRRSKDWCVSPGTRRP